MAPGSSTPTSTSRARSCCRPSSSGRAAARHDYGHLRPARDRQRAGLAGIRYFLEASESLAMTLAGQSQLVRARDRAGDGGRPARGGRPPAAAGASGRPWPRRGHELPACSRGDPALLAKLAAFAGGHIDGHAPLLRGLPLNGYLAAGIRTDHECTQLEEAREKLAKGMFILMREGSIAKSGGAGAALDRSAPGRGSPSAPTIAIRWRSWRKATSTPRCGSRSPPAHRRSRSRAASLGAATAFSLADRGVVAPGYRADLVLLEDLERWR